MRSRSWVLLVLFVLLLTRAHAATEEQLRLPDGFISELVRRMPIAHPTAIAFAPGGRLFVAFKSGEVLLYREAGPPSLFLDLSAEVNTWGDRGLLGIAVHPGFPELPYLYFLYTYDPPGLPGAAGADDGPDGRGARVSRLVRVSADPDAGFDRPLSGSMTVLVGTNSTLENIGDPSGHDGAASCDDGGTPEVPGIPLRDCIPSDGPSHSIGTVAFGRDGALYMGSGDGGRWVNVDPRVLRTLDVDSLAGKILRIDPITGEGLADNPFFDGDPRSNRSRVLNLGLRNPFRFAFHPSSGEVYIGDVGWALWEELDRGRGASFGWPCFEGGDKVNLRQPAYTSDPRTGSACAELSPDDVAAPVFAYSRDGQGTAMIVGDFYTGSSYPENYHGALFYGDYDREIIRVVFLDDQGEVTTTEDFGADVGGIVQLVQGPDTNLYYVLLGERHEVRRLRYVGDGNHPPRAVIRAAPLEGDLPLTVSFVGNDSSDPDTDPLTFSWDFGDGAVSTHPDPVHTFETAGAWTVTLVVRDPSGEEGRSSITILAGNTAPEPEILAPAEGTLYAIGDVLELSGRAFDHQDGELPGEHLRWSAMLHHNDHVHPDFFAATGGSASLTPEDHGDQTWLELELEATDSEGARAVVTRELRPREVALSFRTEPEGLEILYDSTQRPTPFTITTITGSERLVVAPPVQNHRSFARWLDSAERVRRLRVGESDASYVAIYENQPPQAVITVVSANRDPLAVELTATESTDPEGGPLEYEWDPGDGSPLKTGPSFTHVYAGPGAPRVRLVVRDALGAEGTAWLDLSNRRRPVRR